jgi:dTDP-4-amino-4,6-dideoxygalactose transaminase
MNDETAPTPPAGACRVPWSYLPQQFSPSCTAQILEALGHLVASGDLTLGAPVREFEERFARLIGTPHAIGVGSGTDAIRLALKALGVGPGDEVVTAANTFIATVGAIVENHATPRLVDCGDDFCMDVDQLESAITPRTRALLPVHLAGQMTDMPRVRRIAARHGLPVVEDSCQCILGSMDGRHAGTFGDAGAFSLHPLKNLNVWGDGGVVVTADADLARQLRMLRNHGLVDRDHVQIMGCNSRLDSVQAVVGNWLIDHVEHITATRIEHARRLDEGLRGIDGITLPRRYADRRLVYHLYMVFATRRDELLVWCRQHGIQAKVHYPLPVYRQEALAPYGYREGDFPVADRHARTMISLPAHEHLTEDQLTYMVRMVREFYEG